MKGVAGSAMVATVFALGLFPGDCANSLRQGEKDSNGRSGATYVSGSAPPRMAFGGGRRSRHLQNGNDDALDVNGTPRERAENARQHRNDLADVEYEASQGIFHVNNGDRSSAATFHKTLPHDSLGQVDPDAFDALIDCIAQGDFDTCEQVPSGDDDGFLINPIAGVGVNMGGPASSALTVPSAPSLNSEDMAAQMAELYWMALTRDVHFSQYGEDETTVAAAANLATMPGFANMKGVAVGSDGTADPQSQLFRSSAVGVETGPFISQLLVKDFTMDSMTVAAQQTTYLAGDDYMTNNDDWLFIQNGGKPDSSEEVDSEKRYIRNARDLARLVYTDTIYTEAFRGAMILLSEGAISKAGFNGPYENSSRQKGFVNFGVSHVMRILGSAEQAQASSWYQKWNVHMLARPEAVGGTLHNVLYGHLEVDFHTSLLGNEELLERVAVKNAELNEETGKRGRTYFLSQAIIVLSVLSNAAFQAVKEGSPAHPSYPAGHAVQNGAFATVLKALVGLERGADCFEDPVYPDDDGLELLSYTGDDCLSYEGEINKMAVNIAFGRSMCGVHYRFDSEEGLVLGEAVGVRMLQQEARSFPENEGYEFRLMSGETIRLETDGSFYINDSQCSGEAFTGVDQC